jgi:ketosteroid isomerase-like protein
MQRESRPLPWTTLSVCVALLISAPAAAQISTVARDSISIAAASLAFSAAYVRNDTAALGQIYSDTAVLYPPNREIRGRAAIQRYFSWGADYRQLAHAMESARLTIAGNLAVDVGTWTSTGQRGDAAPVTASEQYLVVWVRESDGAWRMLYDMWHRPARSVQQDDTSALPAVTITGPTLIAFWELPSSDSVLIADPNLASALDEQQYFWAETRGRLTELGVTTLSQPDDLSAAVRSFFELPDNPQFDELRQPSLHRAIGLGDRLTAPHGTAEHSPEHDRSNGGRGANRDHEPHLELPSQREQDATCRRRDPHHRDRSYSYPEWHLRPTVQIP